MSFLPINARTRESDLHFMGQRISNRFGIEVSTGIFKCGRELVVANSVNVLALVRDEHRFVFLYDDQSVETVLATLSQYAMDSDLAFTWHDAALMAQRVKRLLADQNAETQLESFPYA